MLTFELRHAVVRIGVLVAIDTVASQAGVRQRLAPLRVPLKRRLLGRHRSAANPPTTSRGDKPTRTHPGTKPLQRHLPLQPTQNGPECYGLAPANATMLGLAEIALGNFSGHRARPRPKSVVFAGARSL